jgi:uncharacterized protein (TIGR02996 family)
MSATRAALEAALAADPDDLATRSAYADLLIEEGDPRGEYIRLQLAAEDKGQPADRLRAMEQQAFALRQQHEKDWLGPLDRFVNPPRGPSVGEMVAENVAVTFRRGWVHRIEVSLLTDEIRDVIAAAPIARLLAELEIRGNLIPYGGGPRALVPTDLSPFGDSPNVRNLRRLVLGGEGVVWGDASETDFRELLAHTPRLEHLELTADRIVPTQVFAAKLPHLRTLALTTNNHRLPLAIFGYNDTLRNLNRLQIDLVELMPADDDDLDARRDPITPMDLQPFFTSKHLTGLRHLALRLPGFGDAGVEELVASGLIDRLQGLDLCRCGITDDGAQALAACPAVRRLEYLHLDNNLLSLVGIDALAAVGVQVSDRQFFAEGWDADDSDVSPPGGDTTF